MCIFVPILIVNDTDNTTAVEVLEKGLNDLMDLCDVVSDKFTVARDNFNDAKADQMVS
jgi:DNA-directed RNA polymerase I and III subunit RPAC2